MRREKRLPRTLAFFFATVFHVLPTLRWTRTTTARFFAPLSCPRTVTFLPAVVVGWTVVTVCAGAWEAGAAGARAATGTARSGSAIETTICGLGFAAGAAFGSDA